MFYELYMRGTSLMPTLKIFKIVMLCFMLIGVITVIAKIFSEKAPWDKSWKPVALLAFLVGILGWSLGTDIYNESKFNRDFETFIKSYKGSHYYEQVKDYDLRNRVIITRNLYSNEYYPKVLAVKDKIRGYVDDNRIRYGSSDMETLSMLAVDTNIKNGIREGKYIMSKQSKAATQMICQNVLRGEKQCKKYLTYK